MRKYSHQLESPSAIEAGPGIHIVKGIGIGIPESHHIKAPPVISHGPVNETIKIVIGKIIEEHEAQIMYDVDGVVGREQTVP